MVALNTLTALFVIANIAALAMLGSLVKWSKAKANKKVAEEAKKFIT